MRLVPLLALGAVLALVPAPPPASAVDAAPAVDAQVLYEHGTGGYECFRIPAIVRTTDGDLLAFAEGRRPATHTTAWCHDAAPIDVVVRRSTDDGATWGPMSVVLAGAPDGGDGEATRGNPAPVVVTRGEHAGRVVLVTTHNPAGGGARTPYVQTSDDGGRTWSQATSLGSLLPEGTGWYATGPQHGIELATGPHRGRLVVGVNYDVGGVRYGGLLLSDDGGDTWRAGAAAPAQQRTDIPQELGVVETPGGGVLAIARNQNGAGAHQRLAARSSDGGATFDADFAGVPDLVTTPKVQGSLLALTRPGLPAAAGPLVFSSPVDPVYRRNLTLFRSDDHGRTWATELVLTTDRAGYSDLVTLGDGRVGVLYEAGAYPEGDARDEIRFSRVSLPD